MVKACRAHVGEHGTSRDGFLFSMASGFPINPDDFDRLWGQAVRRSGIVVSAEFAHPVPYTMRHSHASALLSPGSDYSPAEVASRLGQRRQSTLLDSYSHVFTTGERPLPGSYWSRIGHESGTNVVWLRP